MSIFDLTLSPNLQNALAQEHDGTSGSAVTLTISKGAVKEACLWFGLYPNRTRWPAGTWKINLEVTTPSSQIVWTSAYVNHVNLSTPSQAYVGTIAQSEALNLGLDTAGIKTAVFSGIGVDGVDSRDLCYVVLGFSGSALASQQVTVTLDRLILMPDTGSNLQASLTGMEFYHKLDWGGEGGVTASLWGWWDASQMTLTPGTSASRWPDISGYGNDFTQSVSASMPMFTASVSVSNNTILQFKDVNTHPGDSNSTMGVVGISAVTGPKAVFYVLKELDTTPGDVFIGNGGQWEFFHAFSGGRGFNWGGKQFGVGGFDGRWHIWSIRDSGDGNVTVSIDGGNRSMRNDCISNPNQTIANMLLGSVGSNNATEWGELRIYSGNFSHTDLRVVERELSLKWTIPITNSISQSEVPVSFPLTARTGLLLSAPASSPHITIDSSILPELEIPLQGDLYLVPGGLTTPRGLRIINNVNVERLAMAYVSGTIDAAIVSASSQDAPTGSFLAFNSVVTNRGFVTIETGSLIRNAPWSGGLYMPNSSTVAVYGDFKDFTIPYGSMVVTRSLRVLSGSLLVNSGSIYLLGDVVSFSIDGLSGSAYRLGQPWVILSMSDAHSAVNTASGVPENFDGTLLLVPSASTPNLDEAFLRISGSWYTLITQSFTRLDGGSY